MNFQDYLNKFKDFKCFVCAKSVSQRKDASGYCDCFKLMLHATTHPSIDQSAFHIELNKLYRIALSIAKKPDEELRTSTSLVEFKDRAKSGKTLLTMNRIPDIIFTGSQNEIFNYFDKLMVFA